MGPCLLGIHFSLNIPRLEEKRKKEPRIRKNGRSACIRRARLESSRPALPARFRAAIDKCGGNIPEDERYPDVLEPGLQLPAHLLGVLERDERPRRSDGGTSTIASRIPRAEFRRKKREGQARQDIIRLPTPPDRTTSSSSRRIGVVFRTGALGFQLRPHDRFDLEDEEAASGKRFSG